MKSDPIIFRKRPDMKSVAWIAIALMSTAYVVCAQVPAAGTADAAAARLRRLGQGVMMYANDNRGWLPSSPGLLATYTTADQWFGADAVPQGFLQMDEAAKGAAIEKDSDVRFLAAGLRMTRIPKPAETPMLFLRVPSSSAVVICFVDGHTETFTPAGNRGAASPASRPADE
jgi:hypothetical protein